MVTIRAARRAGVPLVVIESADPQQTVTNIVSELNGAKASVPVLRWDIVRALVGLNAPGREFAQKIGGDNLQIATQNPTECLSLLTQVKDPALVVMLNFHLFWSNESVLQAVWNLRDVFKAQGATLVMLCPVAANLPAELKPDVVVLTDTLPTVDEVTALVSETLRDAAQSTGIPTEKFATNRERINDTLLGLSAFAAEQVLAMSLSKDGVDEVGLWERKRRMIEQTPGLSVWRGGEKFSDVGGYENVKTFVRGICNGNGAPRAIVFIDEIEKSMAGASSDTSGVSQDQLRTLLTYMQDKDAAGVIFIGPPGSGKSAVAKAAGNEANIPTIALDLGGMKGSLVGESEKRLRTALQVVDAVSQGRTLFVATCNSIGILPPELRRRFSLGTFFFPLPTKDDRKKIWDIYRTKFAVTSAASFDDDGWTGAEIRNCCMIAWRLGCSLAEAAKFVVPVSVAASAQIERLCTEAHKRYISATVPGLFEYKKLGEPEQPQTLSRRIKISD